MYICVAAPLVDSRLGALEHVLDLGLAFFVALGEDIDHLDRHDAAIMNSEHT